MRQRPAPLDATLRRAYHRTSYRAATPLGEIRIRIHRANPRLDRLLHSLRAHRWAYLSACNPHSRITPPTRNAAAHNALQRELTRMRLQYFEGHGVGDRGDWPPEPSFLVIGIDRTTARRLGTKYRQNAIVTGKRRGAAELLQCGTDPRTA